jgi:SAM-dependent methyltransferase
MMLRLAKIKKEELVYDLGCGDGRIVVAAAKKHGCRAVGYDIDPDRVNESKASVKKNRLDKLVSIEKKDIFTLDLSRAGVVFLYLLPELNVRLIPQLEKLRPGCRIISHDFDMKGVLPDAMLCMQSKEDLAIHRIYIWTTPLNKTDRYDLLNREEEIDEPENDEPDANEPEMDDGGVKEIMDSLGKES